jgi:hypothetical protein
MTFQKGQSGNPAGRKPGSRNRQTLLDQALLEGEAHAIYRRLIQNAQDGDKASIRLVVERTSPRMKPEARVVPFELPHITSVADLPRAQSVITRGVSDGELSHEEAASLSQVVHRNVDAVQIADVDERLKKLEALKGVARPGNGPFGPAS